MIPDPLPVLPSPLLPQVPPAGFIPKPSSVSLFIASPRSCLVGIIGITLKKLEFLVLLSQPQGYYIPGFNARTNSL